MKKSIAAFCAAAIAITTFSAAPVSAAPLPYGGELINAQSFSFSFGNDNERRGNFHRRGHDDDHRRGFYRQGNSFYLNGYRGFRERRAGYRLYNGYYFPPSAFIGAIIGGIIGGAINR
jgi:hypothetical protein